VHCTARGSAPVRRSAAQVADESLLIARTRGLLHGLRATSAMALAVASAARRASMRGARLTAKRVQPRIPRHPGASLDRPSPRSPACRRAARTDVRRHRAESASASDGGKAWPQRTDDGCFRALLRRRRAEQSALAALLRSAAVVRVVLPTLCASTAHAGGPPCSWSSSPCLS
jgi:hypothetical protein